MATTKRRPKQHVREGDKFGRLLVERLDNERTRYGTRYFTCLCECGNRVSVMAGSLTSGNTSSCGCYKLERVAENGRLRAKHRLSHTKIYHAHGNMMKRCYDEKCPMFNRYGGRGIAVCARWRTSREAFFDDMGLPPTAGHSIDRIDNDGGYWCGKAECPECGPAERIPNCRWVDGATQSSNRSNNVNITFNGRTLTMKEWAKETGIPYSALQGRINHGWNAERALTEPLRKTKRPAV